MPHATPDSDVARALAKCETTRRECSSPGPSLPLGRDPDALPPGLLRTRDSIWDAILRGGRPQALQGRSKLRGHKEGAEGSRAAAGASRDCGRSPHTGRAAFGSVREGSQGAADGARVARRSVSPGREGARRVSRRAGECAGSTRGRSPGSEAGPGAGRGAGAAVLERMGAVADEARLKAAQEESQRRGEREERVRRRRALLADVWARVNASERRRGALAGRVRDQADAFVASLAGAKVWAPEEGSEEWDFTFWGMQG